MSIRNRLLITFVLALIIPLLIFHGALTLFPLKNGMIMTLTVLALGVLYTALSYHTGRLITVPLAALKKAADVMEKGDFAFELPKQRQGEIAELLQSFENMRDKTLSSMTMMRKMEENKKQLLANISHDLRTPITSIKIHIAALEDGLADTPEKQAKYLSVIKSKLEDLTNLTESLFLFSKLDLQSEPFAFQPVPLDFFIQDVVEEWQFRFVPQSVHVTIDSTPDMIVDLDVDKFKRVIVNILDNSANYSGMCPLIIGITLRKKAEMAILSITDSGIGVPPDTLNHLFNQFYRSSAPDRPQSPGSGLGLSIARQIVLAHNGSIRAIQEPNICFTIEIMLPLAKGGVSNEKDSDH